MHNSSELFSLGEIYISDFVDINNNEACKHDLQLQMESDTKAVRLKTAISVNKLFGRYFYKSGINESMIKQLKDIVNSALSLIKINSGDIFCDCASNDGTLLSFVPKKFIRIGVDPIEDKFKNEAEKHSDLIIQDYFSADVFRKSKFGSKKIKILTAIAVLYDIEDLDSFFQDVNEILDDEGLIVVQLSHSGLMIKQNAFDNILSEHVWYLTLSSLKVFLERNNLKIVDCQLNETNGGSFRVYIRKKNSNNNLFATPSYRDVCEYRVNSLLEYEKILKLDEKETWMTFFERINELKEQVVSFIKQEKAKGKTIWCMSASTKGNTLLQYFKLDNTLIDGICERNPDKFGLHTIGTNIPIYSEQEFRKANPDYCLVLAWHFISSFLERYSDYINGGGSFITPCPLFKIINKENI